MRSPFYTLNAQVHAGWHCLPALLFDWLPRAGLHPERRELEVFPKFLPRYLSLWQGWHL